LKRQKREPTYHLFEFTSAECRLIADALTTASMMARANGERYFNKPFYRLWLAFESVVDQNERKRKAR
jgi:hypothetical protein